MEFTQEQQVEINKIIDTAKSEAVKGFYSKEQLQAEVNKAKEGLFNEESLSKRVQDETNKVKTDYDKKIKFLEDELVKYKPKEKSEEEIKLEQRETEIAKKEKNLKIKESLNQNGLPSDFYEIMYSDLDDEKRIGKLTEIINDIVLDGSFKGSKKHNKSSAITKEQFKNMDYNARIKLFEENPTLYAELSK